MALLKNVQFRDKLLQKRHGNLSSTTHNNGSSISQLHDSLGSRRARECSEAGFSSQNGNRS
jgi:hypothetical protein